MWLINSREVEFIGLTPGGDQFTELMDAIIRATAFRIGIPQSDISTNLQTNIADGGVDTKVNFGTTHKSADWLNTGTIWQYKATEYKSVSNKDLEDEINKRYARDCILNGFTYRFCICDSLPAEKKEEWELELTKYGRKINPQMPEAKVLTSDDIAAWANLYPAIILQFFRKQSVNALNIASWGKSITKSTRIFVETPVWSSVKQRIEDHIDFSKPPKDVILRINGESGVGKTRMVYEALSSIKGSNNITVYINDDNFAKTIALYIANYDTITAIIVADECSNNIRYHLNEILKEFLFSNVYSNNYELREATIDALGRLKNEQIHGLAIELLESGEIEFGLTLLKENWKKSDDPLIRRLVTKSQHVPHYMQMVLRDIYSKHRSNSCGDILLHIYRNGECSFCRSQIVTAMGKNGVLTDKILLECQHDSYDETRKYASRLIKRRKLQQ